MTEPLPTILAVVIAFFAGAIPFGYVTARMLKGIDIREHGSRNVGASNVFRTVGRVAGLVVLALDAAKGCLPTLLLPSILRLNDPQLGAVVCAAAAISGHIWTPFLRMRGGKGVATSCGTVLALTPGGFALAFVAWVAVVSVTRYISLGSLVGSIVLLVYVFAADTHTALRVFAVIIVVLIFVRHRSNIRRLLSGTENRISLARRKD